MGVLSGTPSHGCGTSLHPRSGWGYPLPGMGSPLARSGWGYPQPRMGYPPGQVRMGGNHDGGTPWPWMSTPSPSHGWDTPSPQDRLCLDRLCRGQYASCGFPQENFLVTCFKIPLSQIICFCKLYPFVDWLTEICYTNVWFFKTKQISTKLIFKLKF